MGARLSAAHDPRGSRVGRLAGAAAIITGAAQGLGLAIARAFAGEGADVALSDLQADAAAARAQDIAAEFGVQSLGLTHDVTDEEAWRAAIDGATRGLGRLTILVNNAGVVFNKTVEETSLEDWRALHAVDLDSVFLGCKHALPALRASGGGAIVNIASISSRVAGHNLAAYNSAKAAVGHLTKSVALHAARGARKGGPLVRCNSIHPAFARTAMVDALLEKTGAEGLAKLKAQLPIGDILEPKDVAAAAVFLASSEARMITGAELVIDGGLSAM